MAIALYHIIVHCAIIIIILSLRTNGQRDLSPLIKKVPAEVTAIKGAVARLECYVEHVGNRYAVSWLKLPSLDSSDPIKIPIILSSGGSRVTRDTRVTVKVQSDQLYTLEIRAVREEDSGIYQCQISTDPLIWKESVLSVLSAPQILLKQSTIRAKEGEESVTLICDAKGKPDPKVYWIRKDGDILPMGGSQYVGHEMKIYNVSRKDRGVYVCHADNAIGSAVMSVLLLMEFAPSIIHDGYRQAALKVFAALGEKIELSCKVEANPLPNVIWLNSGTEVSGPNFAVIILPEKESGEIRSLLTIISVRPEDYGEYTCEAVNNFGRTKLVYNLFEARKTSSTIFYYGKASRSLTLASTAIMIMSAIIVQLF